MRFTFALVAIFGLICSTITGCSSPPSPPPSPTEPPVDVEKVKAEELKKLEGSWLLKSRLDANDRGTYSLSPSDGDKVVYKIRDTVMEMRIGDQPWVKYATISLGTEPQCLLISKSDISGQQQTMPVRYKLEGDTLTTVQDNLYPDVLPDSFELEAAISRQRQINIYVRTAP